MSETLDPLSVQSVTLAARVADAIKEAIIDARLMPGQRLYEQELSKTLGVSRTPLREAIQRLIVDGWVLRLPGGGVEVSRPSASDVFQVYQVRAVIEGLIAREAATSLSDEQLARVGELTNEMSDQAKRNNTEETLRAGQAIHKFLRGCSTNKLAAGILDELHERIEHYRHLTIMAPGRNEEAARGHQTLFKALKARDPDRAEQVMREDILNAAKRLPDYCEPDDQTRGDESR